MTRLVQPPTEDTELTLGGLASLFFRHGLARDANALGALLYARAQPSTPQGDEGDDDGLSRALELCVRDRSDMLRALEVDGPAVVLLGAAQSLLEPPYYSGLPNVPRQELVHRMADVLADQFSADELTNALLVLFRRSARSTFQQTYGDVYKALLTRQRLSPARILDREAIASTLKGTPGYSWSQATRDRDPTLPDFWATLSPVATAAACAELLATEPIGSLGALALGMYRSLSLNYPDGAALRPELPRIAELLISRRSNEGAEADTLLTRCCWAYAQLAFQENPDKVGNWGRALREQALSELGRLRAFMKANANDHRAIKERFDDVHAAVFFVLRLDPTSMWDVLRRLLLAFRDLPALSVPLDLRTWNEHPLADPPAPWEWVPRHISTVIELFTSRELQRDPQVGSPGTELEFAL